MCKQRSDATGLYLRGQIWITGAKLAQGEQLLKTLPVCGGKWDVLQGGGGGGAGEISEESRWTWQPSRWREWEEKV